MTDDLHLPSKAPSPVHPIASIRPPTPASAPPSAATAAAVAEAVAVVTAAAHRDRQSADTTAPLDIPDAIRARLQSLCRLHHRRMPLSTVTTQPNWAKALPEPMAVAAGVAVVAAAVAVARVKSLRSSHRPSHPPVKPPTTTLSRSTEPLQPRVRRHSPPRQPTQRPEATSPAPENIGRRDRGDRNDERPQQSQRPGWTRRPRRT